MKISKQNMTQATLKEYFNYDENTGLVTWKKKSGSKPIIGARAGSVAVRSNHRVIRFKGCVWAEHRLIWLWYYGAHPVGHIDHINHNELDNRIVNLRQVSQLENNTNSSLRCDNALGVTGVYTRIRNGKLRYQAEIKHNGFRKQKTCKTLDEAIAFRKYWEDKLGFHPNHGIAKPS